MAEDRMMMTAADIAARAMGGEHGDLLRDAVGLVGRLGRARADGG